MPSRDEDFEGGDNSLDFFLAGVGEMIWSIGRVTETLEDDDDDDGQNENPSQDLGATIESHITEEKARNPLRILLLLMLIITLVLFLVLVVVVIIVAH
jgi:hypothetical protein